jgi:predicted nucleotidyltransferase
MLDIKSKELKAISVHLLFNPQKSIYASEIADQLGLDISNATKALGRLVREGLAVKEKRGGHWFYRLNHDYPLLPEIRKIILFKYGLKQVLEKELRKLKGIKEAYIYGSYARDRLEAESDIDILLVGSHQASAGQKILSDLEKYFGREFNAVDMDRQEFDARKKKNDEFIKEIFRNKNIKIL